MKVFRQKSYFRQIAKIFSSQKFPAMVSDFLLYFCRLLAGVTAKCATPPNFTKKTFANSYKIWKFASFLPQNFPAIQYANFSYLNTSDSNTLSVQTPWLHFTVTLIQSKAKPNHHKYQDQCFEHIHKCPTPFSHNNPSYKCPISRNYPII